VTHDSLPRTALVVFVDQTECPWLRVLRRGFRHCFAAVSDGSSWIVCDPLKDRMEINLLRLPADFDLAGFYAGKGYEVLIGHVRRVPCRDRLALAPMTCVAVVKRILGLRAMRVLTPRQLFCHLRNTRDGAFLRYRVESPAAPARTNLSLDTSGW
jgi:hypothetical protein